MTPGTDAAGGEQGGELALWVKRLRARYPEEAGRYTDDQIEQSLTGWLALAPLLGLDGHEDKTRFLGLAVLLSPEQRRSKLVKGVLRLRLGDADLEPKARLDFVYKHLVGRPVSPQEEDFGPPFDQ